MGYSYTKHLFAFMDILGYKSIVNDVENNIEKAEQIISNIDNLVSKCIKEQLERLNQEFKVDYLIFSDSICVAIPIEDITEEEYINSLAQRLQLLTYIIANIQLYAVEFDILLRGAISIGNYYRNENIMFSKALVDAYIAESNLAVYPRIILCHESNSEILSAYVNAKINYGEFLYLIEDGEYICVNYLANVNEFYNSIYIRKLVKKHKDIIESNIEKFKDSNKLLEKYAWLTSYHNSTLCNKFSDLLIDRKYTDILYEKLGLYSFL